MKCPFLITKKDIVNKQGEKIGEEIELQECIKNECMIFDGATKLCSLLSSNMKIGVLIDDLKNGITSIKEEMAQRSESVGVTLSTTVQTLQEALLGRFDILKKQNEVMVLGFDRLVETINNKFEGIKTTFSGLNDSVITFQNVIIESLDKYNTNLLDDITTIKNTISTQSAELKTVMQAMQQTLTEIKNGYTVFFDENKCFNGTLLERLSEYSDKNVKAQENTGARLQVLNENIEKLMTTNQVSMEALNQAIDKIVSTNQEFLTKLNGLDTIINSITDLQSTMSNELGGFRTDSINAIKELGAKFDTLTTTFADTMRPGIEQVAEFMKTEVAGLKAELLTVLNEISSKFDNLSSTFADTMKPGIENITEFMKTEISGLKVDSIDALNGLSNKIDALGKVFSEATQTQERGFQRVSNNLSAVSENVKSEIGQLKTEAVSVLQGFKNDISNYIDAVKTEVITLKTDQVTALNNVQGTIMQLQELFKQSTDSLGSMSDMMKALNNNYLESLSKIAGLAEGMRKGVAKVGEGMHDSVKDLVKEMKQEISALEKQYEKTFADIANLAGKFDELNKRLKDMTKEVEAEFKDSFSRQEKLSDYTKNILEHIKLYFEKEEARYKEEQALRKKKEALDHFDRATLYYYRGNYEIATTEINKALEIEKTAEYLNLKGLLLAELGQFEESKKVYKEALKLEPDFAEIHNNLGLLYLKVKKLDDAVLAFQEAVKKNINYGLAYVNLGKVLLELEKFDDAIKAYEKALEIDPTNREALEAIKLYKEGKIGE